MAVSDRVLGLSVPVTEVLDAKLWKARYAHGVLLGALERVAQRGGKVGDRRIEYTTRVSAIPDPVIRWHLRCALSELEMKIGMPFGVQVCKAEPLDDDVRKWRDYDRVVGRMPYVRAETEAWFRIDLPPSVISVERVRAYYFGTKVWELSDTQGNTDKIRIEWGKQGIVHLLPTNLQSVLVTQGGQYGIWHTVFLQSSPVPDFWAVDYTTGPIARNGQVGHVEAVLADWVACVAGMKILSLAGMAVSKGLTSASVSMDGVSRSVGLQASAIYGLNSALEHVLDEATKRIDWKALRAAKRGLRVKMYGY